MGESSKKSTANRESIRAQVIPAELRGLITRSNSQTHSAFLVWDVSERGLGIWSSEELKTGEKLKITIGQPYLVALNCEVKWCEPHSAGDGYRSGLKVTDNPQRLAVLYQAYSEGKVGPASTSRK